MRNNMDNPYLLLTPGPLSTSPTVRAAMWYDSCTWDNDYKNIVSSIRSSLLSLAHCDSTKYTTVLMQGSGSFGVESVLGSAINREHHRLLILANGVYGQRMVQMATVLSLPHVVYAVAEHETFNPVELARYLADPAITHVVVVHCETTTGILNDIDTIAAVAKQHHKTFIVDAMSSFGGIPINVPALKIDFLISSANKCIQGVPGFSFVICEREALQACQHNAKSLSLDLYSQWEAMEKDPGKWRYTSPTHVVLAFQQALHELAIEGGIAARHQRYQQNQHCLATGMRALGFNTYIDPALQSPIITTFLAPACVPGTTQPFNFDSFYHSLKSKGFVIYPGKVTARNTFRLGNIGHLFITDVQRFLGFVREFCDESMVCDVNN